MSKENKRKQLQDDPNYRNTLFEQAERYFNLTPCQVKLSRKTEERPGFHVSFLKSTKGSVFALTGHRYRNRLGRLIQGSDAKSIKLIQDKQGKTFFLKRFHEGIEKSHNWHESHEVTQAMFGNDFHEVKRGNITYHVYPYLGEDWEAYIDRKLNECQKSVDLNTFCETLLDLCHQAIALVEDFHRKKYVHADIKLNNFTVTLEKNKKPTLKLIDFGIARNIEKHQPLQLKLGRQHKQIPYWAFTDKKSYRLYTFTQHSDRWTLGWALKQVINKVQRKHSKLAKLLSQSLEKTIQTLQENPYKLNNPRPEKIQNPIPLKDIPTYALATQKGKTMCAVTGVSWGVLAMSALMAGTLSVCSLPDANIQSAILIGLTITAIVACIIAIPTTLILARDNHRFHVLKKVEQQKQKALGITNDRY